jgi:hypothetical protein
MTDRETGDIADPSAQHLKDSRTTPRVMSERVAYTLSPGCATLAYEKPPRAALQKKTRRTPAHVHHARQRAHGAVSAGPAAVVRTTQMSAPFVLPCTVFGGM